ncbi:MAG TPA: hypothetical protein DCE78_10595 [Bacteroidetes bacterium]|nr:hypothetical protein [Bacteroidota bacterium]
MQKINKAKKGIVITLVVYLILVATHLGEFWPFSIYPMFSQAGNPWNRAMARDISDLTPDLYDQIWDQQNVNQLPGEPFVMRQHGVDQIDYSNFVSKTTLWSDRRIDALRNVLGLNYSGKTVVIYRVRGAFSDQKNVEIQAFPLMILSVDSLIFNPKVDHDQ